MAEGLTYYSQCGQDRYVDRAFRGMKNGIYVEAGAVDGIEFSNTLFLQRVRNWTGLLIEPNAATFSELQRNRSGPMWNVAIGNRREDSLPFWQVTGGCKACSCAADAIDMLRLNCYLSRHGGEKELTTARMVTTQDALDRFSLTDIDYFSLDTDGHELESLDGIDWSRVTIKLLTVENIDNDERIRDFMRARGYTLAAHLSWDDVYALNDLI